MQGVQFLSVWSLVDERYNQLQTKYEEENGSSNRLESTKELKQTRFWATREV